MQPPRSFILLCLTTPCDQAMVLPLLYDAARRQSDRSFVVAAVPESAYLFVDPPSNLRVVSYDPYRESALSFARKLHRDSPRAGVVDLFPGRVSRIPRSLLRMLGHRVTKPQSLKRLRRSMKKAARTSSEQQMPGIHLFFAQTLRRAGVDVGAGAIVLRRETEKCIGVALPADRQGSRLSLRVQQALLNELARAFADYRILIYGGSEERSTMDLEDEDRFEWSEEVGETTEVTGIAALSYMVSTDNIYQHIAAMADVPVVSIGQEARQILPFRPYRVPRENCMAPESASEQSGEELVSRVLNAVKRDLATE